MNHQGLLSTALILLCVATCRQVEACEAGLVRDAAFDQSRSDFRLCVLAQRDDPSARQIEIRLRSWLESVEGELNLEVVYVDADDPAVSWTDYGIPSVPPELPVVVLVGRRADEQKSFVQVSYFVDYWQPNPTPGDLDVLADSPARAAIRREAGQNLAVVVHVPSSLQDADTTRALVDDVCRQTESSLPVAVVTVDREDPRERLLLSFIGAAPGGPEWIGVAFGRGKFMKPLEGEEISETGLTELLETLMAECTCTQTPERLGVDLLMRWDETAEGKIERLVTPLDPADAPLPGMSVEAVTYGEELAEEVDVAVPNLLVLWIVGGLVLVSALGSAVVLLRR